MPGAGGESDQQRAGEGDQPADHQHPRETLAQQDPGQHADQDRCELDQHGCGPGVDLLLAGVQRDVVDPNHNTPISATSAQSRPVIDTRTADDQAQGHGPDDEPAEAQRPGA